MYTVVYFGGILFTLLFTILHYTFEAIQKTSFFGEFKEDICIVFILAET